MRYIKDLNTLEDMVTSLFVHIERKDVEMPIWVDPIYKEEQLATKTIVVPVKDVRELFINFLINDQRLNYKSMPTEYLNAIFNHKSISAILCMRGWVNGFLACNVIEARGIEYYEIIMDLTDIGLDYVDAIIKVIFQYVNMLKLRGPLEWIHEETKLINALEFQYKDNEPPLNYVTMLTPQMIRYNLNDVLIAKHLIEEWKPDLITELLSYFKPDNMRVTVISKTFQGQTNAEDKYYGTPFAVSKIPMETINFWLEDDICEALIMPSKNKYVASNFALVPIEIHKEPEIPKIFYNSSILRCWLKIDTEFRLPKAYVSVDFFSPIVAVDPFNCNIMDIFMRLFNEDFSKHIYNASRAKLHLKLKSSIHGFNFVLYGFNQMINKLLKRIIERLLTFTIDSQRLEIIKEEKIRKLKNIETENPYRSATRYSSMILSETSWSPRELLKSIGGIGVDSVRDFMNNFWSHLYIESLMYGNLDRRMAVILINLLEKPFLNLKGFRPLLSRELIRSREVEMGDGENKLYERTTKFHSCSGVQVNLQCGIQNINNNVVVSLFNQIIEESCYNILRTQEQLGYVVTSIIRKSNGVLYFCIIVQSDYNPIFVHTRIEHYLSSVESLLNNLTDEEFLKHKESLATKLLEKPKGMFEQAIIYSSDIIDQCYIFKAVEFEVKILTSITKADIIEFYQQKINLSGPKRRMLSVYIRSTLNPKPDECSTLSSSDINLFITSKIQKIDDINEFKKSHRLYPAPGKLIARYKKVNVLIFEWFHTNCIVTTVCLYFEDYAPLSKVEHLLMTRLARI
ncbi:Uncharacterized protein FWK35_00007520 [Aphis craccivora]|uniref:Nardilysin-like n=1 Tax=Aphis craccivora TaxID=307492 RepID=A0A6G0YXE3_APHCR|nr:Uncharacterized protein FWK35_00007520 [Aphis craccivora]